MSESEQYSQYSLEIEFNYKLQRVPKEQLHFGSSPASTARREIIHDMLDAGYAMPAVRARWAAWDRGQNHIAMDVSENDENVVVSMIMPVPGENEEDAVRQAKELLAGVADMDSLDITVGASVPLHLYSVSISGAVEIYATDEAHACRLAHDSIRQESVYPNNGGMDVYESGAMAVDEESQSAGPAVS